MLIVRTGKAENGTVRVFGRPLPEGARVRVETPNEESIAVGSRALASLKAAQREISAGRIVAADTLWGDLGSTPPWRSWIDGFALTFARSAAHAALELIRTRPTVEAELDAAGFGIQHGVYSSPIVAKGLEPEVRLWTGELRMFYQFDDARQTLEVLLVDAPRPDEPKSPGGGARTRG